MTNAEAIEKLKEVQECDDKEIAHCDADNILCDLLLTLGYDEVVVEYTKIDKWFS